METNEKSLQNHELLDLYRLLDLNNDGKITYTEYFLKKPESIFFAF